MQHFGLLGAKLGHSLSPQIHGMIFEELGIDADYKLLELPAEALKTAVPELAQSYTGVNVTIPHKIEVMPFLDSISDEAAAIGAVNTISFNNGKSCGYNTDWLGFGMMLEYYGIKAEGKKAAVLGIGGASRAVVQYLAKSRAKEVLLVSRNPQAIPQQVVEICGNIKTRCLSYEELAGETGDIIINCTPVGMYPKTGVSPVTEAVIKNFGAAADLIYNPAETEFLRMARTCGKTAVNGLLMLAAQAVAAQEIWQQRKLGTDLAVKIMQAGRKIMKNIVLIGMPGCGKTTLGKLLAAKLKMEFYDADNVLEQREPYSIKEFFAKGEEVFREAEQRTAEFLSCKENCVVAAGGGVVKKAASMAAYAKNGIIVFIDRPADAIVNDVEIKTRPLLAAGTQRVYELYDERIELYRKYAAYIVKNADSIENVLSQLVKIAGEMKK